MLDKEKIKQQNMGQQIKNEISIMKLIRHRCVRLWFIPHVSGSVQCRIVLFLLTPPIGWHHTCARSYVVQLREVLASRTKIFIVLEFVTGGELFEELVTEGR